MKSPLSEDERVLSTKEAARSTGYTHEYIARLCRDGQVRAMRRGRVWLISAESLEHFHREMEAKRERQRKQLSLERRNFLRAVQRARREASEQHAQVFSLKTKGIALALSCGLLVVLMSVFSALDRGTQMPLTSERNAVVRLQSASVGESVLSIVERIARGAAYALLSVTDTLTFDHSRRTETDSTLMENNVFVSGDAAPSTTTTARRGMVVVPSTSDDAVDAAMANRIRQSFSDTVQIESPSDGDTAGVIRPVFRSGVGEEYLYVMVPVAAAHE